MTLLRSWQVGDYHVTNPVRCIHQPSQGRPARLPISISHGPLPAFSYKQPIRQAYLLKATGEEGAAKKHGPAWRPPKEPPKYQPPNRPTTTSSASPAPQAPVATAPTVREQDKLPVQQKILNGILAISNVPYSSFVPTPTTPLHIVDARVKLVWLVAVYWLIARSTPVVRLAICATIAAASVLCLPERLWRSQLLRLGILCGTIFVCTALFSGSIPGVLQPRGLPHHLAGLPPLPPTGYSFVVLHVFFITVTHRSINLAITAACLTFASLQSASLCLVTTPGEEMAMALAWWLAPLKLLRVPVRELSLTLLLSLRFMSLVFEEVRNLSLGLAARGVDWRAQGLGGSLQLAARLFTRLFGNLAQRSDNIAAAMVARGFVGPEAHETYMMQVNSTSLLANALALLLLAVFAISIYWLK